jgi:hypothetical protein
MSEPAKIVALTVEELELLLEQAAERGAVRALAGDHNGNGRADRWLTPEEAAAQYNASIKWIYRHARKWQFVRRPTRKKLLISEAGLNRWMAARNKVTPS